MKQHWTWIAVALLAFSPTVRAETLSFTTFVPSSAIGTAEGGNTSAIAFNYAGNKFVGTVYFDNQLYTTNLAGGAVTVFGTPLPESSSSVGEVVVGASLGQSGFPLGNIYAGSGADGKIYQYANSGGAPALFATLPPAAGQVRQIFFDPGSTFGGNMIVATTTGNIYVVNSAGTPTLLVNVGEDTEGLDIAPSTFGPYAGDLMVSSELSGSLRFITPAGVIATTVSGLPTAETVSTIPLNLDLSNPLEGFYVANYSQDVQFASAGQFISQGILGTTIVTSESGGSHAWDIAYTGSGFSVTPFTFPGNQISQFEDGIFVTPQRITDTGGGTTPEPSSILLLGTGLAAFAGLRFRKMPAA